MTTCEKLVAELGQELDLELAPGTDGTTEIAVEGRLTLIKPDATGESATIYTIVAMADGTHDQETMRAALSINLFGLKTLGGHLGMYLDAFIYSCTEPLADLTAEALADKLVAFARTANEISEKLKPGESRPQNEAQDDQVSLSAFMRA